MTLKVLARALGQLMGVIVFSGCTIPRIDFDGKLNSTIGSPLSTTYYDKFDVPELKSRLSETLDVVTYKYKTLGPAKCAWTVDVDKKTNLVLSWKYTSQEAADSCRDLRAGPKP